MRNPWWRRGKKIINNKWIYGNYVQRGSNHFILHKIYKNGYIKLIAVEPKTLGMYTGLLDCNNRDAYEGDIVDVGNNVLGEIIWDKDKDMFLVRFNAACITLEKMSEYRIVGNIWDNPKLLKEIYDKKLLKGIY